MYLDTGSLEWFSGEMSPKETLIREGEGPSKRKGKPLCLALPLRSEERPREDKVAGRKPSPEAEPARTLMLDVWPPEPRGYACLRFQPPACDGAFWPPKHTITIRLTVSCV